MFFPLFHFLNLFGDVLVFYSRHLDHFAQFFIECIESNSFYIFGIEVKEDTIYLFVCCSWI